MGCQGTSRGLDRLPKDTWRDFQGFRGSSKELDSRGCKGLQGTLRDSKGLPRDFKGHQGILRGFKGSQRTLGYFTGSRGSQRTSAGLPRTPVFEGPQRTQKDSNGPRGFQRTPSDPEGLQGAPRDFEGCRGTSEGLRGSPRDSEGRKGYLEQCKETAGWCMKRARFGLQHGPRWANLEWSESLEPVSKTCRTADASSWRSSTTGDVPASHLPPQGATTPTISSTSSMPQPTASSHCQAPVDAPGTSQMYFHCSTSNQQLPSHPPSCSTSQPCSQLVSCTPPDPSQIHNLFPPPGLSPPPSISQQPGLPLPLMPPSLEELRDSRRLRCRAPPACVTSNSLSNSATKGTSGSASSSCTSAGVAGHQGTPETSASGSTQPSNSSLFSLLGDGRDLQRRQAVHDVSRTGVATTWSQPKASLKSHPQSPSIHQANGVSRLPADVDVAYDPGSSIGDGSFQLADSLPVDHITAPVSPETTAAAPVTEEVPCQQLRAQEDNGFVPAHSGSTTLADHQDFLEVASRSTAPTEATAPASSDDRTWEQRIAEAVAGQLPGSVPGHLWQVGHGTATLMVNDGAHRTLGVVHLDTPETRYWHGTNYKSVHNVLCRHRGILRPGLALDGVDRSRPGTNNAVKGNVRVLGCCDTMEHARNVYAGPCLISQPDLFARIVCEVTATPGSDPIRRNRTGNAHQGPELAIRSVRFLQAGSPEEPMAPGPIKQPAERFDWDLYFAFARRASLATLPSTWLATLPSGPWEQYQHRSQFETSPVALNRQESGLVLQPPPHPSPEPEQEPGSLATSQPRAHSSSSAVTGPSVHGQGIHSRLATTSNQPQPSNSTAVSSSTWPPPTSMGVTQPAGNSSNAMPRRDSGHVDNSQGTDVKRHDAVSEIVVFEPVRANQLPAMSSTTPVPANVTHEDSKMHNIHGVQYSPRIFGAHLIKYLEHKPLPVQDGSLWQEDYVHTTRPVTREDPYFGRRSYAQFEADAPPSHLASISAHILTLRLAFYEGGPGPDNPATERDRLRAASHPDMHNHPNADLEFHFSDLVCRFLSLRCSPDLSFLGTPQCNSWPRIPGGIVIWHRVGQEDLIFPWSRWRNMAHIDTYRALSLERRNVAPIDQPAITRAAEVLVAAGSPYGISTGILGGLGNHDFMANLTGIAFAVCSKGQHLPAGHQLRIIPAHAEWMWHSIWWSLQAQGVQPRLQRPPGQEFEHPWNVNDRGISLRADGEPLADLNASRSGQMEIWNLSPPDPSTGDLSFLPIFVKLIY